MLGPSRKQAGELPGAMHVEAVYLRGGGGRARGEAGRRRRVRDRAQSAHRNESESPPSAAPPRGPACARAPLPPTPGPCNQHAARVAPPPPYPSGLSPAGSTLSRRPTLVPGPRSVLEPSGRALRLPWVKGQVASFPGGGRRARSFTSAGRLEKPRKRAPFLPPPAAPFGGLRGVLATNRRARCRGRPLSRSRGGGPRAPAPARCVAFSRVPSRTSGLSLQRRPECRVRAAAARVMAGQAFKKFLPLFDRVLVERSAAETVTKGGIMLPEKSQGKVLQATVVAVGSGSKGKGGEIQPVSVKVGDKVLLPEYGGTKVVLDDKDYFLFRDADILGKYTD
ncbi:heat shock protein 1 (chaperonin 10) [Cricetulus griseus]